MVHAQNVVATLNVRVCVYLTCFRILRSNMITNSATFILITTISFNNNNDEDD